MVGPGVGGVLAAEAVAPEAGVGGARHERTSRKAARVHLGVRASKINLARNQNVFGTKGSARGMEAAFECFLYMYSGNLAYDKAAFYDSAPFRSLDLVQRLTLRSMLDCMHEEEIVHMVQELSFFLVRQSAHERDV